MIWYVRHRTVYRYDSAVFLEPQLLRLKPTTDANQRLLSFELMAQPEPEGLSNNLDVDGNDVALVWFEGRTHEVVIETASSVETLRQNPFDYIWTGSRTLPMRYEGRLAGVLDPYLRVAVSPELRRLAESVERDAGGDGQAFLAELTGRLHADFTQERRDEGAAFAADETLQRGSGSCRDLTVLFMAVARSRGFAARFVSGYCTLPVEGGAYDLHAWPEVYVPGGGWRGYDPTMGLAVAQNHIAIARSSTPNGAAPVTGSFRGSPASSLEFEVTITSAD